MQNEYMHMLQDQKYFLAVITIVRILLIENFSMSLDFASSTKFCTSGKDHIT